MNQMKHHGVPQLGFIGVGAIAEAVIRGLIQSGYSETVRVSIRNRQRSRNLSNQFQHVVVESNNQSIVDQSDWVFIAVLPDQARPLLRSLNFREDQRLISLVAGIEIAELKLISKPLTQIHRLIPLPPIEFGVGPLPICPPHPPLLDLFEGCGAVIPLETEDSFAVFSAASGLMAAHHQWVSNIADWMHDQGVNSVDAAKYATQMVRALTEIEIRTPNEQLPHLADQCTTAGGLNEQAIRELRELDWFQQSSERLSRLLTRLKKGL